ncbi:hypothetical protein AYI68_g1832 [Smittium mucronatum]|uniref:Uncharacterized protein n=1 Tax=Smittium mucronatum TaxID=133383 RepID=A0A1R0H4K1_9FUNG|nr:hypothetical protein AYI68_g1832 [Smittium mucronatum]
MAGRYCVWHLQHWPKVYSVCHQCPHKECGGQAQAGCDLNMDVQAATKFTSKLGAWLELAKVTNSSGLRWNKDTVGRMIDHIFYSGFNCRLSSCLANCKIDLSDQMPISAV